MTDQSSNKAGVHVVGPEHQQPILKASPSDIKVMLDIIEHSILPITEKSVKDDGNKVFGAAILNSDLSLSVCSTNSETECPIFHGEVKCIYDWSKLTPSSERGTVAQSSIFLSTHEPCCMCISSILWAGFNKLFFWLPYEVTTDQGIPHVSRELSTMLFLIYISLPSSLPFYRISTPCMNCGV